MTIIHCVITFVGSYYDKDFHVPMNVINPCKRNSYYICGKSRYVCSRQWLLRLWKMNHICGFITWNAADVFYICGLLLLRLANRKRQVTITRSPQLTIQGIRSSPLSWINAKLKDKLTYGGSGWSAHRLCEGQNTVFIKVLWWICHQWTTYLQKNLPHSGKLLVSV